LVATFPPGSVPADWLQIGVVSEGDGVTVDGAAYEGPAGHTHF
jgi:thiamine-monophosphate kinase